MDHTIKVCHSHLPSLQTVAGVDGLMRAVHRPLQEDVGRCLIEKEENVVDKHLRTYTVQTWVAVVSQVFS